MRQLTWQEQIQKWIKRHKKRAATQSSIGAILAFVLMMGFNLFDQVGAISISKDPQARITIGMVGDMMFGRNIELLGNKYGYGYLFEHIQPCLNHADMMTGNFENSIITKENSYYPEADKPIHLSTKPEIAKTLEKVGFKTLNIANNHVKDYGKKGLQDTVDTFRKVKVDTIGAGENIRHASKIAYHTINGIRVATIGISDVLPKSFGARKDRSGVLSSNPVISLPLVTKAKGNADLVLVHVHWGLEYDGRSHPRQQDIGHALVDAGADVVIGHHPHVLEPVEVYKEGVIFYSLGNFIFDQGWSRTKESILPYYKILRDGTIRLELHPIFIREGRPRLVTGWGGLYRRERIFAQVTQEQLYTLAWKNKWKRQGDMIYRELKRKQG